MVHSGVHWLVHTGTKVGYKRGYYTPWAARFGRLAAVGMARGRHHTPWAARFGRLAEVGMA